MQLSTVFTILVTVITAVTATLNPTVDARDYTNGERMARHLPPKPPMRRGASTPVYVARRSKPSPLPKTCDGAVAQCCDELTNSSDPVAKEMLKLLGTHVHPHVPIGFGCTNLTPGHSCTKKSACCDSTTTNSVGVGCTQSK